MPYPQLPGKHALPSLHGPADFLDHALASGWDPGPLPVGVVFTFFGPLPRRLEAESERFEEQRALAPSNARFFATADGGPRVGVSCLSPGAPAMATQVENLIHLGVRRFLIVGAAGAITDAVATGDCVLLTGALRDDGVSQHYLDPEEPYALPDEGLTGALRAALAERRVEVREGRTWTVPVPYRTTREELVRYAAEGVVTVEMEAAALFAVAAARQAQAAAAVVVSDVTTPAGRPSVDWALVGAGVDALLGAGIAALRATA